MKSTWKIPKEWKEVLEEYLETEAGKKLTLVVQDEYMKKTIFPPYHMIFKAFEVVSFSSVAVVILGQDPYHGDGQAEGLAFSVPTGIQVPPSLKNIYKEIKNDTGIIKDMSNGNLLSWAQQGVLLLNSILTVVAHTPSSHRTLGWEACTDSILQKISDEHEHIVFMLWGNYAIRKRKLLDEKKHLVLTAPHPSPFSCHTGFFGSAHFSRCNEYLRKYGRKEIAW